MVNINMSNPQTGLAVGEDWKRKMNGSVCAILTSAAQSVCVFFPKDAWEIIIFDSHARQHGSENVGASFLFFSNLAEASQYIRTTLFPSLTQSGYMTEYERTQYAMMNMGQADFFCAKSVFAAYDHEHVARIHVASAPPFRTTPSPKIKASTSTAASMASMGGQEHRYPPSSVSHSQSTLTGEVGGHGLGTAKHQQLVAQMGDLQEEHQVALDRIVTLQKQINSSQQLVIGKDRILDENANTIAKLNQQLKAERSTSAQLRTLVAHLKADLRRQQNAQRNGRYSNPKPSSQKEQDVCYQSQSQSAQAEQRYQSQSAQAEHRKKVAALELQTQVALRAAEELERQTEMCKQQARQRKADIEREASEALIRRLTAADELEAKNNRLSMQLAARMGESDNDARTARILQEQFNAKASRDQAELIATQDLMRELERIDRETEAETRRLVEQQKRDAATRKEAQRLEQLERQNEASAMFAKRLHEESVFLCVVCQEDSSIEDAFELNCPNNHKLCRGCGAGYVQTRLKDRQVPIPCPHDGCNSTICERVCMEVLNDEDQLFWLQLSGRPTLDPDFRQCESPNCTGYDFAENGSTKCTCLLCQFHWCTACHVDLKTSQHKDITCEAYQRWRTENASGDEAMNAFVNDNIHNDGPDRIRKCPHCQTPWQKDQACSHVTCGHCRKHFCFRCAAFAADDGAAVYAHQSSCRGFDITRR